MLKGTLDDFTLPDVFRLMSFAKKTGRVDVVRSAGQGKVFFRDGEVYYAESSLSKERLGQKLVRARAITEGQLMKALDEQASSGERLGTVLLQAGVVTEEQLLAAVRQQIEDSVFDLLRWELGEFAWEPGEEFQTEVHIAVSVENLIMEASRRLDEFEVIRRKIPSGAAVLGMAATPPEGAVEINITPDEWRILVLVDGSRTVAEIATMVGLDEFGAMRVLYGLVSAGLIELMYEKDATEPAESIAEVVAAEPVAEAVAEPVAEEVAAEPDTEEVAAEPDAETVAESPIETETIVASEAYFDTPPEPVSERETIAAEDEPMVEPSAQPEIIEPPAAPPLTSDLTEDLVAALSGDPAPSDTPAELESDDLAAFGIVSPDPTDVHVNEPVTEPVDDALAASTDSAVWSESDIEAFDAPAPDELVTSTPAVDPFMDDLFDEPAVPHLDEPPAPPAPIEEEIPVSSAPSGEAPSVDRAAVVRELAGLFSDEDRPMARPSAPRPAASSGEADERKRVEDDDQVTKGIISRLIDGVKGL